jgi:DNA-binding NarL/FixJ family response regulator
MPIRVLIADDHAVVRDGLSLVLSQLDGFEVVGEAATGDEAVRQAVILKPDVVLMDIQMPGLDGVEATRQITDLVPSVAVLMLSMYSDEATAVGAMRAGARGYLLKGAGHAEVTAALHAVVAGQAIFGQGVADVLLAQIGTAGPTRVTRSPSCPNANAKSWTSSWSASGRTRSRRRCSSRPRQ